MALAGGAGVMTDWPSYLIGAVVGFIACLLVYR
jgi:hypothetical protein